MVINSEEKNKSIKFFSVSKGLKLIRNSLLEMGNLIKESYDLVTSDLKGRKISALKKAALNEEKINALHIRVDDLCWKVLARQSPVAIDLRTILASVKINGDLERVGDQLSNIYKSAKTHLNLKEIQWPKTFFKMLEATRYIFFLSLNSLKKNDLNLAQQVFEKEDEIDDFQNQMIRNLIKEVETTPNSMDDVVTLILMTRSLERIGDHATNIAEDVIFISSGKDIRHGHKNLNKIT